MYKIKMEENVHDCRMLVYLEDNLIIFEADTLEDAKKDANRFVLELLKDTGRIGY